MLFKLEVVFVALTILFLLTGCANTIAGVGRDLQGWGEGSAQQTYQPRQEHRPE